MKTIKIAVYDDNREFLDFMQKELLRLSDKQNITFIINLYRDGKEIENLISRQVQTFDILFLDIDMPDMSGLDVAKRLRERNSESILIFLSAYEQYVFEAIEYQPFRYIRKERILQELPLAMKAACSRLKEMNDNYIIVKTPHSQIVIKYEDIMYFQTNVRKVELHLNNGNICIVRKTIRELYEEVRDCHFIKIHSGGVVNIRYIRKFSYCDITLDNGEQLMVSRRQIKAVKTALMKYWGGSI